MKIQGSMKVPVDIDEDQFDELFLEWCEQNGFEFQGRIEDTSKS